MVAISGELTQAERTRALKALRETGKVVTNTEAIESVVGFGNTAANTFEGAYEAIKAIWGLLPAAIGDLAFQAANSARAPAS